MSVSKFEEAERVLCFHGPLLYEARIHKVNSEGEVCLETLLFEICFMRIGLKFLIHVSWIKVLSCIYYNYSVLLVTWAYCGLGENCISSSTWVKAITPLLWMLFKSDKLNKWSFNNCFGIKTPRHEFCFSGWFVYDPL